MWINDTTYIVAVSTDDVRRALNMPNLKREAAKYIIEYYAKEQEKRRAEALRPFYKKVRENVVSADYYAPFGGYSSTKRARLEIGLKYTRIEHLRKLFAKWGFGAKTKAVKVDA